MPFGLLVLLIFSFAIGAIVFGVMHHEGDGPAWRLWFCLSVTIVLILWLAQAYNHRELKPLGKFKIYPVEAPKNKVYQLVVLEEGEILNLTKTYSTHFKSTEVAVSCYSLNSLGVEFDKTADMYVINPVAEKGP